MKQTRWRWPVFFLVLLTLVPCFSFPVKGGSEVPYQTYTYDKWGNATPTPNGYIPERSIGGAQLGCGNFSQASDMFYSQALGHVYVVDSGNSRIVVLDESMRLVTILSAFSGQGQESLTLDHPQGIFVSDDGSLYICNTGSKNILIGREDGTLLNIIPEPSSSLLPDNFNYQPTKIVVDEEGRMYVISKGTYQGLIYLEQDGSFIRFFGPNAVEMTFQRRMLKIWKSILSDKAASTLQSFNPIEYGNVFYAEDGYIYAVAAGSENGAALMTKLNPVGIDVLPYKSRGTSLYSDVCVNEDGITTMLDTNNGLIFQVDKNGQVMFIFGGIGEQVGLFKKPVSLIEVGGSLYVMDADKNTITEFIKTQFGDLVHQAIALYDQGLYQDSVQPWQDVISHDTNYLLAYTGLGKAYYQMKDYDMSLYYFRLANDRADYSTAFREASLISMRKAFPYVMGAILALLLLRFFVWIRTRDERKRFS